MTPFEKRRLLSHKKFHYALDHSATAEAAKLMVLGSRLFKSTILFRFVFLLLWHLPHYQNILHDWIIPISSMGLIKLEQRWIKFLKPSEKLKIILKNKVILIFAGTIQTPLTGIIFGQTNQSENIKFEQYYRYELY